MSHSETTGLSQEIPKIFFSAGEPSGDIHAASLIQEIRRVIPDAECVGYGGPEMAKAGCCILFDMTQMAIMWFARIAARLFQFRRLVCDAQKYFAEQNVKAVVLVDFPGFNWWIAAAAKKCGIPVYYYMPPQIWAWGQWRIKKMEKYVDAVFTCLPFETRWYSQHGCRVIEIGHPFIEEAKHQTFDADLVEQLRREHPAILAVLPGSRDQEITSNLKEILQAVKRIRAKYPEIQPIIGALREPQVPVIKNFLEKAGLQEIPILTHQTQELIRAAKVCIAVSGSVSMELMIHRVPTVIYYRLNPLAYQVQRFFRRVRYITLVNILGVDLLTPEDIYYQTRIAPNDYSDKDKDNMVFPEFLTPKNRAAEAAEAISFWLKSPKDYEQCRIQLGRIHQSMETGENPFHTAAKELKQYFPEPEDSSVGMNTLHYFENPAEDIKTDSHADFSLSASPAVQERDTAKDNVSEKEMTAGTPESSHSVHIVFDHW
ncbi:MAG: lipid-A-disaccharide synthase [Planctomycetaceae bacterium]|jgi:lipid-A-disaccharide synthase|nr:lipid-A-disaccharide synthase [Planctomycetaceae bacterium]